MSITKSLKRWWYTRRLEDEQAAVEHIEQELGYGLSGDGATISETPELRWHRARRDEFIERLRGLQ